VMVLTIAVYRLVAPAPRRPTGLESFGRTGNRVQTTPLAGRQPGGILAVDEGYTQVGVMKPETGNWSDAHP